MKIFLAWWINSVTLIISYICVRLCYCLCFRFVFISRQKTIFFLLSYFMSAYLQAHVQMEMAYFSKASKNPEH